MGRSGCVDHEKNALFAKTARFFVENTDYFFGNLQRAGFSFFLWNI